MGRTREAPLSRSHDIVITMPMGRTVGLSLGILGAAAALGYAGAWILGRLGFIPPEAAIMGVGVGTLAGLVPMMAWLLSSTARSPGGLAHGMPGMTVSPLRVDAEGVHGAVTMAWSEISEVEFLEPREGGQTGGAIPHQAQGRVIVPQWGAIVLVGRQGASSQVITAAGVDSNRALFADLQAHQPA